MTIFISVQRSLTLNIVLHFTYHDCIYMYMTLVLQAHELAYYMWDLLERWEDCLNSQHRADGAKIMQTLKNCDIPVVSPGKSGESQTHLTEVRLYPQTLNECLMHNIGKGRPTL